MSSNLSDGGPFAWKSVKKMVEKVAENACGKDVEQIVDFQVSLASRNPSTNMEVSAHKLPETEAHLRCMGSPDYRHIFVSRSDKSYRTPYDPLYGCHKTTLAVAEPKLLDATDQGAGVFIQPNRDHMQGKKRFAVDVEEAHMLFLDIDRLDVPQLTHKPTLKIRTRRGYQFIFRLHPTRDISKWRPIQRAFTRLNGGDLACVAPNQLMRLAGYLHQKRDPFRVSIEDIDETRIYTLEEFYDMAPAESLQLAVPLDLACYVEKHVDFPVLRKILNSAVARVHAATQGNRWLTLRAQAYHLGHYLPFGMSLEHAYNGLMGATGLWDGPRQQWHQVIVDSLRDGASDSRFNPPLITEAQRAKWDREDAQENFCELIASVDWPAGTTSQDILEAHESWTEHWDQRKAAVIAVNRALVNAGYTRKSRRVAGMTSPVHAWSK